MGRIEAKLKIELRSDLCVGSGYGYAGIIDTDVAYDAYGLPAIPARRLKGCMREAAKLVCPERVESLFGMGGQRKAGGIVLGNAYIENYRDIVRELQKLKREKPQVFQYLSQNNILNLYTGMRAQTKIENDTGIAEDNSLRYIRVVGQYNPLKKQDDPSGCHLCFFADLEYDGHEEEDVKKVLKATRNIGMNRNRGLGSIYCSIVSEKPKEEIGTEELEDGKKEEKVCVTYILNNVSPLMMSSGSDSISDSYISGKSILGKLAGSYLDIPGKSADSDEFKNLFLNGNTIFTDALITSPVYNGKKIKKGSEWNDYFPAPLYINKTKKSKKLVNILKESPVEEEGQINKGDLPKKLKNQYVCEVNTGIIEVAEVEKEIIYHHSRNGRGGEEGMLYCLEAVKAGQYFKGRIYTDSRYASMLKTLLHRNDMRFGKSKMIQYGLCEFPVETEIERLEEERFCARAGEHLVVTLCSDAIFMNESGYTVKYGDVRHQIAEKLKKMGLDVFPMDGLPDKEKDEYSIVQTKEISGYHTKWNLRRPGIPAVKAGSTFVFQIGEASDGSQAWTSMQRFVGERNLEGYGEFQIFSLEKMRYDLSEADVPDERESVLTEEMKEKQMYYSKKLLYPILAEEMLELLVAEYITDTMKTIRLNASTIGRITLMLEESLYNEPDPKKAFKNFCDRITSIKRTKEQQEALRFLREIILKDGETKEIDIKKMERESEGILADIKKITVECLSEKKYQDILMNLWGKYLMIILTYHKYQKKHEQEDWRQA